MVRFPLEWKYNTFSVFHKKEGVTKCENISNASLVAYASIILLKVIARCLGDYP